jgi:hypothetical protein
MVAACRALEALSARNARFDGDPVAGLQALHFTASPDDDTGTFMAEHVRACHLQCADLTVFPEVYVGAANGISGDSLIVKQDRARDTRIRRCT